MCVSHTSTIGVGAKRSKKRFFGMTRAKAKDAAYVDTGRPKFGVPPGVCNQYANLYFARLAQLSPLAKKAAQAQWGGDLTWVKTLDAEPGEEIFLIGTLYKEMTLKPNILKEEESRDVIMQQQAGPPSVPVSYCSDSDSLLLEDESGRIQLSGAALENGVLVTGAVVAVRGRLSLQGVLEVDDICLPGLPPQPAVHQAHAIDSERYVALVSGLHIGQNVQDLLPLTLLSEYLTGQLGGTDTHKMQAATVRLIVAGNSMCDLTAQTGDTPDCDVMGKVASSEKHSLTDRVGSLDAYLTTICAAMPVDLMPGSIDPCNFLLPQQPLHKCILPQASRLSTLNLCTNPHSCCIDGVSFLGSSGQPLDDIQRCTPLVYK